MRFATIIAAIAAMPQVLAMPTEADPAEIGQLKMKWTGVVTPGEEPTVLYGDIYEIKEQIFKINPHYQLLNATTPELGPNSGKFNSTDVNKGKGKGRACNVMGTASINDMAADVETLKIIGGNCEVRGSNFLGMSSCRRIACENTSGVYICAESHKDVSFPCKHFGEAADAIFYGCCSNDGGPSGNEYFDAEPAHSVWIGYCNNNAPSNIPPSTYLPGSGNNKACWT